MANEMNDCGCGCNVTTYSTDEICPKCKAKLRLVGRPEHFEFRLSCGSCGYESEILPQEEVTRIL